MTSTKEFSPRDLDRIIEMAWEDRTPFEALLFQFGLPESDILRSLALSVPGKKQFPGIK